MVSLSVQVQMSVSLTSLKRLTQNQTYNMGGGGAGGRENGTSR